jgi:hypothetical protein
VVRQFTAAALVALVAWVSAGAASGSGARTIGCPLGSPVGAFAPAFSADGTRVAFAQPMASGVWFAIGTANVSSGVEELRARDLRTKPTGLAWSPRDRRLAYVAGDELHVVDTGEVTLFRADHQLELGGWSPDARFIYVSSGAVPNAMSYRIDTASGAAETIGEGAHVTPSPDGTRVALVTATTESLNGTSVPGEGIDVIDLSTGARRTIFHGTAEIPSLAWSPDSKQVAFLWSIDIEPDLMAQNADGSSTGLFGRAHGALPTQIGMEPPFAWTASGIVGASLIADKEGLGIVFYDTVTGKERGAPIPMSVDARFGAAAPSGRTIAYLAQPINSGDPPPGLRLEDWDGKNDRAVLACRGSAGNDVIRGSPMPDRIRAGAGNDTIDVRGGGRDAVSCGSGRDRVYVGRGDRVSKNCERVVRAH